MEKMTYRDAGVDIDAGNKSVSMIKDAVRATYRPEVMGDLGGFGGLFALNTKDYKEPILVSGTDGVGTKLRLAFLLGKHDTIGQDAVAMCVNDILVQGAEPLFFLDYLAVGKLVPEQAAAVVKGVAAACKESGCALIGGETAEMAVRIALTGHALFSTLHTEDTASAVFRMIEMGVPPYLLAATLSGVIAQRLVRRVCAHCREAYVVPFGSRAQVQLGALYHEGLTLVRGRGCAHCHGSGYRGRMAIHEILPVSERIRSAILSGRDKASLHAAAVEDGMETLWQDAAAKVLAGETTLAEVGRVLYG